MLTIAIIIYLIIVYVRILKYKKTEYYKQTKTPFKKVRSSRGKLGEYYIYKYLKNLIGYKRFLFNVYVPKDNEETTEIDVILLHESGIYVFESKNYSGWIFGNETQQYWTQVLPKGRHHSQKTQFLNPIIQNNAHIKWLKTFLNDEDLPFVSIIAFSDRCTLKDITLINKNHFVINRYKAEATVQSNASVVGQQLSNQQIDELYNELYPLTQTNSETREKHISDIKSKMQKAVCPLCGAELVKRVATKGNNKGKEFWGCSRYPKCRYIRKL